MRGHPVELYVQPGCGDCQAAERFLKERGIPFVAYDIRADEKAYRRLVKELGSLVTATLVIGDEVIKGFGANRQRVEQLLAQQ